jgi:hypothetical protein
MNLDTALEIARISLGIALLLANIAVWYGVWLERDSEPPEVQQRGWRILLLGLAAETAIGLFAFGLDMEIGARQGVKSSAAQERAADADVLAGQLGVRVNHLGDFAEGKEQEIAAQMRQSQSFESKPR